MKFLKFLLLGIVFGIVMAKSEAFHGSEFRKCFAFRHSICMELLEQR